MSLAVVGAITFDDIATPAGSVRGVLGGSGVYVALAAALIAPVHLVSTVGEDLPPAWLAPLRRSGVSLEGVQRRAGRTFRWACRYHADWETRDTLFTDPGVFRTAPLDVPMAARHATHLCLTSGDPAQNRAALELFPQRRVTLVDTIERELREERAALLAIARAADLVTMNESEAALLTGAPADDIGALLGALAPLGPWGVLLKRGPRGVTVATPAERVHVAAAAGVRVVDPTGAGDAFAGGVLSALWRGDGLVEAARWGCAVASFAVEAFGVQGLLRATPAAVSVRAARIATSPAETTGAGARRGRDG